MIIYSKSKSIQCPTSEAGSRLRLHHGAFDSYSQRCHQTTRSLQHQRQVDDRKSSEVISFPGTIPRQHQTESHGQRTSPPPGSFPRQLQTETFGILSTGVSTADTVRRTTIYRNGHEHKYANPCSSTAHQPASSVRDLPAVYRPMDSATTTTPLSNPAPHQGCPASYTFVATGQTFKFNNLRPAIASWLEDAAATQQKIWRCCKNWTVSTLARPACLPRTLRSRLSMPPRRHHLAALQALTER